MSDRHPIIIVGGGLVGASLALGLARAGQASCLIESHELRGGGQPNFDDRTLALSLASTRILNHLGVWNTIAESGSPIRHIHVSTRGSFGTARIHAEDYGLDYLGVVAKARVVGTTVLAALKKETLCSIIAPASVKALKASADTVTLELQTEAGSKTLSTDCLIGADGAQSFVRNAIGLTADAHDYEQTAMIMNVTTDRPHNGWAYERFTPHGTVALLPHGPDRMGAVWCLPRKEAVEKLEASDERIIDGLQSQMGYRAGRITRVGKRSSYPLHLVNAPQVVRGRCAIIGNAAHTIHPIGAQGFNLGLRDIAHLVETLPETAPGAVPARLLGYQALRETDQKRIVGFSHGLAAWFAINQPWSRAIAAAGLVAVDTVPMLKRSLVERTLGLGSRPPVMAQQSSAGA